MPEMAVMLAGTLCADSARRVAVTTISCRGVAASCATAGTPYKAVRTPTVTGVNPSRGQCPPRALLSAGPVRRRSRVIAFGPPCSWRAAAANIADRCRANNGRLWQSHSPPTTVPGCDRPERWRRNRPEHLSHAAAEREQRSVGAGGSIELDCDRQARRREARRQHEPRKSGRAAGSDIARDRGLERYPPAADRHILLGSDRQRGHHDCRKNDRGNAAAREVVVVETLQAR